MRWIVSGLLLSAAVFQGQAMSRPDGPDVAVICDTEGEPRLSPLCPLLVAEMRARIAPDVILIEDAGAGTARLFVRLEILTHSEHHVSARLSWSERPGGTGTAGPVLESSISDQPLNELALQALAEALVEHSGLPL